AQRAAGLRGRAGAPGGGEPGAPATREPGLAGPGGGWGTRLIADGIVVRGLDVARVVALATGQQVQWSE
ncbi:MAG TPA: hypothetical protein PKC83_13215, partial [Gemmatimonadaceae bacterium]|nr:hypothetical protein [Gemmatimonadaceae bacterium]